MATILSDFEVSNIAGNVLSVKCEIEIEFDRLIESLRERKNVLLTQLDEYMRQHSYSGGDQKPSESEKKYSNFKRIVFDFDTTVLGSVSSFGKINSIKSGLPLAEYKGKVSPLVKVGGIAGNGDGELHYGFGLAVNYRTNNIYIADHSNHRVQAFDSEGRYLFKFGDVVGNGKMGHPVGIAIFREIVYVSQQSYGCLFVYDSVGNYISQIGSRGNGKYELNDPRGLAIDDTNGNLYICDHLNHKIKLYTENCVHSFGEGVVNSPATIHLTRDGIFVQVVEAPFLHKFDSQLNYISINLSPSFPKHINYPYSSCIDGAGRIVVSDRGNERISIFDKEGYLLHQLFESISKPMGVAIDSQGRIVVVGFNHSILIF